MIKSMTSFARKQYVGSLGSIVCELKSVNHRYLELSVKLPESLYALESSIRECIRKNLKRGKVECQIRYLPGEKLNTDFCINTNFVKNLCIANEEITKLIGNMSLTKVAPVQTMDILRWPGVLQVSEVDLTSLEVELINLLQQSLEELIASRLREGEELKQLFLHRLASIKAEVIKIREYMPEILKLQRERLIARFTEIKAELDSNRLEQEILIFSQKIDVSEELERIATHISEVRRVLKHGGVVGRRLDFLMQELNREANTLGAKSVNVDTTRASVEMKVLIEQIREQVQNVE
ncbi:YicC family protein [Gammaproteobacteria bacterium]|nr:YicC family protein [Gammaproteobacteria bacterium]